MSKRKMNIFGYLKTGPTTMHSGGWRHPEAVVKDILDPARYEQAAMLMESACLDGAFFADLFGLADTYKGSLEPFLSIGGQASYLDPVSVLPYMARATRHLGLGTTVSTSFFNPFSLARSLGSLDVLSGGRICWNVVTSSSDLEFKNAGLPGIPPHAERYDRAEEFLQACLALWNTWDEDPFFFDKEKGVFADAAKVHYANYEGKYHKTRGPLPTPRSAQGHPVIMQAGSSERGRKFASDYAEVVFQPAYDRPSMIEFYNDIYKRIDATGRDPAKSVKILPAITPVIGETESIARERFEYLHSLEHPEYNMAFSSMNVGADLSKHKTADEVMQARGNQGSSGIAAQMKDIAAREKITVAELGAKSQHNEIIVGTPTMVADHLCDLFEDRACDGFVIMPVSMPVSHEQFCRSVVPILQRRGVFRTEYASTTLRGNLFS